MYDYTTPSKQIIYGQLSLTAKRPVTEDDIQIVSVKSVKDDRGDTVIRLKATTHGLFTGERDYYYNRHPIENLVAGLELSIPYGNYVNSLEVLSATNAKYGFGLTFSEIEEVTYGTKKTSVFDLVIKPDCLVWQGTLRVHMDPAPNALVRVLETNVSRVDIVTGFRRGKITGALVYAPYEFQGVADKLNLLANGEAMEYQVLDILQSSTNDPWVYVKDVACDFNLANCKVEKVKDQAYNKVRIHLSALCTNVYGYIELKYI